MIKHLFSIPSPIRNAGKANLDVPRKIYVHHPPGSWPNFLIKSHVDAWSFVYECIAKKIPTEAHVPGAGSVLVGRGEERRLSTKGYQGNFIISINAVYGFKINRNIIESTWIYQV